MKKNNDAKNKYDNSRDLQIWIWSNKPAIKGAADFLVEKLKKSGMPNNFKVNRLKNHLKVFLTDLYVCHKHDKKMYISISLDRNNYFTPTYFKKIFLNYKYVKFIVTYLYEQKYIELKKGFHCENGGRKTRIRSTDKLLRLYRKYDKNGGVILFRNPVVILKDTDKNEIPYDLDSQEVRRIIRNTNKINKYLSQHEIELEDIFEDVVTEEMYMFNSKYYRVFNNSSFEQGGRFYGHWSQMIKSEKRRLITIDGKVTTELDYSCLHISMLYGLTGQTPPPGDLYHLEKIPDEYRKVIKKAVNIAINAESHRSAMSAMRDEIKEFCEENDLPLIRPKFLLREILEKHAAIGQYICSGYGVHLQYMDSCIAEKIMLSLGEQGIACLCIHDSFIVAEEYEELLLDLMRRYFYEVFNFYPNVSAKYI